MFRGRQYSLEGVEVSKINLTRQGDNAQDQGEGGVVEKRIWLCEIQKRAGRPNQGLSLAVTRRSALIRVA